MGTCAVLNKGACVRVRFLVDTSTITEPSVTSSTNTNSHTRTRAHVGVAASSE